VITTKASKLNVFHSSNLSVSRTQWPCGLRRRSTSAWLLESRLRIPLTATTVCLLWLLCVVWEAFFALGWSLIQRCPAECTCVSNCVWSGNLKTRGYGRYGLLCYRKNESRSQEMGECARKRKIVRTVYEFTVAERNSWLWDWNSHDIVITGGIFHNFKKRGINNYVDQVHHIPAAVLQCSWK
jgi:hypothetical protein